MSVLGVVPQRNGLRRMDGQVRNDAVGLDLSWPISSQPQTRVGSPSAGGAAPGGDFQPIVVLA